MDSTRADESDTSINNQGAINNSLTNMVVLYFSFSLCLALLTETITVQGNVYVLKIIIEIILMMLLTFVQEKTMTDIRFHYKKLCAINMTVWIFGKILFYSIDVLRNGDSLYRGYSLFMISQVIYHSGEFLFTATCHINLLSWDSNVSLFLKLKIQGFLINHSKAYGIAQLACHSEFWIESYFFPEIKVNHYYFTSSFKKKKYPLWIILLGTIISITGHFFRLGAFMSARSNFTHLIQHEKRSSHQLITTGIYSIARHPSYLGWFLSTVGGQLLLINPVCFIGFTLAAWYFFYDRILYEEYTLYKFFGSEYITFMNKTPIWIPFLQYFIDRARRKSA